MENLYYEEPSLEREADAIDFINEFVKYNSEINGSGEYFTTTKYKSLQDDNTVNHDLTKRIKRYYTKKLSKEEYASKEIFPLLNKKKKHYPNTVILIGNTDPLIDENKEFAEREKIPLNIIGFAYHGFLNTKDKEIIKEYTTILNDFINNNN